MDHFLKVDKPEMSEKMEKSTSPMIAMWFSTKRKDYSEMFSLKPPGFTEVRKTRWGPWSVYLVQAAHECRQFAAT